MPLGRVSKSAPAPERVASLRASGKSWPVIARRLHCTVGLARWALLRGPPKTGGRQRAGAPSGARPRRPRCRHAIALAALDKAPRAVVAFRHGAKDASLRIRRSGEGPPGLGDRRAAGAARHHRPGRAARGLQGPVGLAGEREGAGRDLQPRRGSDGRHPEPPAARPAREHAGHAVHVDGRLLISAAQGAPARPARPRAAPGAPTGSGPGGGRAAWRWASLGR
jgi:hypothetical protein